ncbi:hypothetical protein [Pseudomonas sp. TE3610]
MNLSLTPLATSTNAITGLRVPVAENMRVPGVNGGINLDLRDRNPQGLLVYVQPYVDMEVGDQIDLRWGTPPAPVGTYPVTVRDQPVVIRIPWDKVTPGIEGCDYDVRRVDGSSEGAPGRQFLVKFTRPGGNDPQAGVPGHQGLIAPLLPQDIIDNGVGEEEAAAGVPLRVKPYLNMSEGDTLEVRWGAQGLFKWPPLQAHDVGSDVIITVPEEAILLGGDGPNIPVCYRVIDQVYNYSLDTDKLHWSPNTLVDVYANNSKLAAPFVVEAVDGVIDLDVLNGADVTVEVVADRNPPYAVGDTIELTWRGTSVDEQPVVFKTQLSITRIPQALNFTVPYSEVSALYTSRAVASYELLKADDSRQGSRRTPVDIKGNPLWLAPPVILDAADGAIAADLPVARVQIPAYSNMAEGDQLTFYWHGVGLYGEQVDYEIERPVTHDEVGQPILRLVNNTYIAPLDHGRLNIRYTVLNSKGLRESDRVYYTVGAVGGALPAPQVEQAQGDLLNPYVLPPEGATLVVPLANIVEIGDTLTFSWRGSSTGLFEGSVPIRSLQGPLYFNLDRDLYVEPNLLGTIAASYRVIRDGRLVGTSATLNLRVLAVLPAPSVKQANGSSLDPVAAKDNLTVVVPTLSALLPTDQLVVTWTGAAGSPVDGSYTSPARPVSAGLEVSVPNSVLAYSLGAEVTVSYHVTRGNEVLDSEVLVLAVQPMPGTALDQLIIVQAANAGAGPQLDLGTVTAATVRVGTWPLIAPGQPVWLDVRATRNDGSLYAKRLWDGGGDVTDASWISQGFNTAAITPFDELLYLRDGSSLTLTFKAALDRVNDESRAVTFAPRTYVVKAPTDLKPSITRVQDIHGEVPHQGTTVERTLTLTGGATPNQRVEIRDGTASVTTTAADATGVWRTQVSGLANGAHVFSAKGLYGTGQTSNPWQVTIAQALTPVITAVTDPASNPVPNGGTTVASNLTLTGNATANLQVDILDNSAVLARVTANASGVWTYPANGLAIARHGFTARAAYGDNPVSQAWVITVSDSVVPVISSVKDPSGGDIGNGASTFATHVTLLGTATPNLTVDILDNGANLGRVTVSAAGVWTLSKAGLAIGGHSFVARANYGETPSSHPWVITVKNAVVPIITSVKDPSGADIGNGASTFATNVTLMGTAAPNLTVDILDNSTVLARVTANTSGVWTYPANGLAIARHAFTARAAYGDNPVSQAWVIAVTEAVVPIISSVKDPSGADIGNGASTFATNVTLMGTAAPNLTVDILDNGASLGRVTVSAAGVWTHAQNGLAVGGHSFVARATYGSNPQSSPRTLTVLATVAPTITYARDPQNNDIPNGGSTIATTVTLTGKASPNQQVQVADGGSVKGTPTANGSSDWSLTVSGLALGSHSFTARALYGTGPVSAARTLTVRSALEFGGNHTLNASGYRVVQGRPPSSPPANATYTRAASGGSPPYSYSSSNPGVALVNGAGRVVAGDNGTTTITARDSAGTTRSYQLTVTGAIVYVYVTTNTFSPAMAEIEGRGLRIPSVADLQYLSAVYSADQPMDRYVGWPENGRGTTWTNENANWQGSWKWAVHLNLGTYDYYWIINISLLAVGIKP